MNPNSSGATLVTGASGFIGRHVTLRLLQAGRPVIATARGRNGRNARQRLTDALFWPATSLSRSTAGPVESLIEVLECDLSQPRTLDRGSLARLRGKIETVIHCAGDTNFFPADLGPARAVSVESALALIEALRDDGLRRWCHISTAFVCGQRSGTVFEHEGDAGQEFHNPYERIKLQSELALRESCLRWGIELCVLRPSIVIGATIGSPGSLPSDLFFQFIRLLQVIGRAKGACERVRIPGVPDAAFNIVPMDYVSKAVVALAFHPEAAYGAFHLVVENAPTQQQVLQMINSYCGVRSCCVIESTNSEFASATPSELRLARMLAPYRPYLLQDVRFDDTRARRLLRPLGVAYPQLDATSIKRFVDQAGGAELEDAI